MYAVNLICPLLRTAALSTNGAAVSTPRFTHRPKDARKAKAKAAFEKGKSGNPTGKAAEQVPQKSGEAAKRDRAAEHARTTVGRIAQKCKPHRHSW